MSNFLLPKIGCNLSSARISRLFFGFWRSCFLMCAQIFFVTSLRGSGSVPTILARCSEGCIGFIKPLFFALGAVFAIFLSVHWRKRDQLRHHRDCNGSDWQMARNGKGVGTRPICRVVSVIGMLRQPFAEIASWVRPGGYGHGANLLGQTS